MFLADFSRQNLYEQRQQLLKQAQEERRNPGITLKNAAVNGAAYGALSPLVTGLMLSANGVKPRKLGKSLLTSAIAGGVTGAGLSMLLRSPRDLKGEGAKDMKGRRLLKNVGRGALVGAGLAGVGALRLRGRGYGLQDLAGKTFNNVTAGAALGSAGALAGTKLYNRFKKDEK